MRVNRLPGHVYFSHRAHVGVRRDEVRDLPRRDEARAARVTSANVHLEMATCISCHEAKSANNDCIACHK